MGLFSKKIHIYVDFSGIFLACMEIFPIFATSKEAQRKIHKLQQKVHTCTSLKQVKGSHKFGTLKIRERPDAETRLGVLLSGVFIT